MIQKLCQENLKTIITDDTNNEKLDDDAAIIKNLFAKFFNSTYSKDEPIKYQNLIIFLMMRLRLIVTL